MKIISILSLILAFVACKVRKETTEVRRFELIGVYKCNAPEPMKNHYIIIDTTNYIYNGTYLGTVWMDSTEQIYYEGFIENLIIKDTTINFKLNKSGIYKEVDSTLMDSSSHFINFEGKITNKGFIVNCTSKYVNCWGSQMEFKYDKPVTRY